MSNGSQIVVYTGPKAASDLTTRFSVRDDEGAVYRLPVGVAVEVPASLAKELLDGSERTEGHSFEAGNAEDVVDRGLADHTIAELRGIAAAEDVDLAGIELKDDIVAAIEANREGSN